MRTAIIFFALAVAASVCCAQWVHTSLPGDADVRCFATSGTHLFAGTWTGERGGNGVFLSTNNGTNWIAVNEGLPRSTIDPTRYVSINCFASDGQNLFAGTNGAGVYLSSNSGTSWTAAGLTNTYVNTLAVSGTNIIAGGGDGDGIFVSTNNGASWTQDTTGLGPVRVNVLAVSGTNLFAGTRRGVFLSTNNGRSWTAAGLDTNVCALAFSGTNIFAGSFGNPYGSWPTLGHIFRSTNNGITWSCIGLESITRWTLAVSDTNLFAAPCCDSLFLLANSWTNWIAVNAGLSGGWIQALTVSGMNLFAGNAHGAWRRPLSEMITSVSPAVPLPTEFVLSQNHPNPFNPSTTIRYALPHTSFVTLTVYNTLGQQVAQLVNEQQQAGYHDVVFRGDGLASGVYFYRLQAGSFVDVKKLILLR